MLYRADLDVEFISVDGDAYEVDVSNSDTQRKLNQVINGIKDLINRKAKVIVIIAHAGNPTGNDAAYSLAPLVPLLSTGIEIAVNFLPVTTGLQVEKEITDANFCDDTTVLLLENIRFSNYELSFNKRLEALDDRIRSSGSINTAIEITEDETEMNDDERDFCACLSSYADVYVNDCLDQCGSNAASMVGITAPGGNVAGIHVAKAIDVCGSFIEVPRYRFIALLSGDPCIETIQLFKEMVHTADEILLGGELAHVMSCFLSDKPLEELHFNPVTPELRATFIAINKVAAVRACKITLPIDILITNRMPEDDSYDGELEDVELEAGVPLGSFILDVGVKTVELYSQKISQCRSLLWSGALGLWRVGFHDGTRCIIDAANKNSGITCLVADANTKECVDTVCAQEGLESPVSNYFPEASVFALLRGKQVPGIAALSRR